MQSIPLANVFASYTLADYVAAIAVIAFHLFMTLWVARKAEQRGRSHRGWMIAAVVFGWPLALIALYTMKSSAVDDGSARPASAAVSRERPRMASVVALMAVVALVLATTVAALVPEVSGPQWAVVAMGFVGLCFVAAGVRQLFWLPRGGQSA
jgi:hypothetical protein